MGNGRGGRGAHPFPPPHATAQGSESEGHLGRTWGTFLPNENTLILRNWDGEVQRERDKDRGQRESFPKSSSVGPGDLAHFGMLGNNF